MSRSEAFADTEEKYNNKKKDVIYRKHAKERIERGRGEEWSRSKCKENSWEQLLSVFFHDNSFLL
jgi:hypothetical protein